MDGGAKDLEPSEYRALAEFRGQLRRFIAFSERAAREAGVEPRQHQLMLAIKGLPEGVPATIGELASRLLLKHHSTVELVDRLERRGAVIRKTSEADARAVIVQLTRSGEGMLHKLSIAHRQELEQSGPELARSLKRLIRKNRARSKAA
jgi:DNA-binding MarR family transcriptional regulator